MRGSFERKSKRAENRQTLVLQVSGGEKIIYAEQTAVVKMSIYDIEKQSMCGWAA